MRIEPLSFSDADKMIRVRNLNILVELEITCRYLAGTFLAEGDDGFILIVQNDSDTFQVQQDIDDIFLHAFHGAVFVQHTIDLHFGDRTSRHGRQQNASQRIAQRMSETTLQRLQGDSRPGRAYFLNVDVARGQKIGYRLCHCT